ncbi:MAG: FAD binding domain-containing protein, partial [Anaerolineaceae bacterium]|nr:FAD binding domain-containing protein [Anaerolineaceae bacterium]
YIGSAVSLNVISRSPLVIEHAEALSEACSLIGGPQVRNTATLGGNVAHALPAADGTIALLACDARVDIATPQGLKQVDLSELFLGPGKSALAQDEIIAGFRLPLKKKGQACAFKRVMRMQGVALPIINMAVWVERAGETIGDIRITIGPAGKTPYRAFPAEDVLRRNVVNEHSIGEAYSAVLANAVFRSSPHRAGSKYRKAVSGALLNTLIRKAWDRSSC